MCGKEKGTLLTDVTDEQILLSAGHMLEPIKFTSLPSNKIQWLEV